MELADLARRQAGVFTRKQARAAGLSDRQISRALATGRWRQYFPDRRGVFADATLPDSYNASLWAAILAHQPCALALQTAAARWGWCEPPAAVQLIVPARRRTDPPIGVQILRMAITEGEVTTRNGLPLTTPVRTLADCLRLLPRSRARDILDRSQQCGGPPLAAIELHLPLSAVGTRQARQILRAADGTRFEAERRAAALLRDGGVQGWEANVRLRIGRRTYVVDFAFPEIKLALEIDGFAYHSDPAQFQRDRERQNALVGAGWTVLRFTWADLVERPEMVLDQIREAIRTAVAS